MIVQQRKHRHVLVLFRLCQVLSDLARSSETECHNSRDEFTCWLWWLLVTRGVPLGDQHFTCHPKHSENTSVGYTHKLWHLQGPALSHKCDKRKLRSSHSPRLTTALCALLPSNNKAPATHLEIHPTGNDVLVAWTSHHARDLTVVGSKCLCPACKSRDRQCGAAFES